MTQFGHSSASIESSSNNLSRLSVPRTLKSSTIKIVRATMSDPVAPIARIRAQDTIRGFMGFLSVSPPSCSSSRTDSYESFEILKTIPMEIVTEEHLIYLRALTRFIEEGQKVTLRKLPTVYFHTQSETNGWKRAKGGESRFWISSSGKASRTTRS